MNTKLNVWVKRLLDFSFYVGCVMEVTAYFWIRPGIDLLEKYFPNTNEFSQIKVQYFSSILIIMGTGLFALAILYELRKMMKTVIEEDCFVQQNVKSLDRMGGFAFAIVIIKAVRSIYIFTATGVVVAGVFFFAGLFSKVLARVFDQAVKYKQENDLTI